jgi:hypothetical protein
MAAGGSLGTHWTAHLLRPSRRQGARMRRVARLQAVPAPGCPPLLAPLAALGAALLPWCTARLPLPEAWMLLPCELLGGQDDAWRR